MLGAGMKRYWLAYIFSLIFVGISYLAIMPPFEGFDEQAHYSLLRELSSTKKIPLYGKSYLDQFVVNFPGPVPYSLDGPPFDNGVTYSKFFNFRNMIEDYQHNYRYSSSIPAYQSSHILNWQAQHPPLYYLLLAPILSTDSEFSFTAQLFSIRLISFLFAIVGVIFGLLAIQPFKNNIQNNSIVGFILYPVILPMFFIEFTRIGNDSLCLFFVGLLTYLFSIWIKDEYSIKKSIIIGVALGFGLLTKALFLPILFSIIIFLLFRLWVGEEYRIDRFRSAMLILISALMVGGGWYLNNLITLGHFSGSNEAIVLSHQGGLWKGLKEHFSFYAFIHGVLSSLVTFSAAGTRSMAHLPGFFQIPLLILACWVCVASIFSIRKYPIHDVVWMPIWIVAFFVGGLIWHVLVGIALWGVGATPGWYLHILLPWIAPFIGLGVTLIFKDRRTKRLLLFLIWYAALYHAALWWAQFALFTGCATKGVNGAYVFSTQVLCIDQAPLLMNRATVLGYPGLAVLSLVLGVIINIWLFLQIWGNNLHTLVSGSDIDSYRITRHSL